MIKFSALLFLFLVSASPSVFAQEKFAPPETLLQDNITYTVHWDGTYSYEEAVSLRLNTASAVQNSGQAFIYYSGSKDQVELLNAYSITPSGQRIDVLPDQILDQPNSEDSDDIFNDGGRKVLIFPRLSPGSIEHYHYILDANGTYFPGQFFAEENFPVDTETKSASITVITPAVIKLFFEVVNMQGGPAPDSDPSGSKWIYTLHNVPAVPDEPDSVGINDFSPRLDVTSFTSYPAIADAYEENAASKAAVTPAVQQLANQITQGITSPHAQAVAIYNWVSRNIRYVAVGLDYSGYIPHQDDDIIESGYGDCKDHVTLLTALLAAKHINSSGVLVNAGNEFYAPNIAMPTFNHIITYIPQFDVYLDSTAQLAPFGVLPSPDTGKQGLITGGLGIPARLVTIPLSGVVPDEARAVTRESLSMNGTISGATEIHNAGQYELEDRLAFADMDPGTSARDAARLLQDYGEQGSGDFATSDDPLDPSKSFSFQSTFTLPYYASLPGPGTFPIPIGVPRALAHFQHIMALPQRTQPTPCMAQNIWDDTSIATPSNISIKSLPKAIKFTNGIGSYSSSYSLQDHTIFVERRLLTHPNGSTCSPAEYAELRDISFVIGRDFRSVIGY